MTSHDHGNCGACDLQDAKIARLQQRVEALETALDHERYRNHEHTEGCDGCLRSDALRGGKETA